VTVVVQEGPTNRLIKVIHIGYGGDHIGKIPEWCSREPAQVAQSDAEHYP